MGEVLKDGRHLRLLNRETRRLVQKMTEGEDLVEIDLNQKIEAYDASNTLIPSPHSEQTGKNDPPTLREASLFILRTIMEEDKKEGISEKKKRFALIERLKAVDKIELTDSEIGMITERGGKLLLQVELIGKIDAALHPKSA